MHDYPPKSSDTQTSIGHRTQSFNISAVSKHFEEVHAGDTTSFTFMGIEKVYRLVRGGDHQKKLGNPDGFLI